MKDNGSASPILHVHRARGQPVLVHQAFVLEVGEGRPFVHVRQLRIDYATQARLSKCDILF